MANAEFITRGKEVRQKILTFIVSYIEQHGYPPSFREIATGVGLKSLNSVKGHIDRMFNEGMLESDADIPATNRTIRVPGYKFVKIED